MAAVAAKAVSAVAVTIVAIFFISPLFLHSLAVFPGVMIALAAAEMKCSFAMISMHSAHDRGGRDHARPSAAQRD